MAEIQDGNERKELYRKLLNDPITRKNTVQYSFKQWENKVLSNDENLQRVADYAIKNNWALDAEDFLYKYAPEKVSAPPTPKPQAAPKQEFMEAPSLEEQEAYIPEPQPLVGSPEYGQQLEAQYGGMAPTLGATFGGVPAAFETKEQKKQEQISPAFKAQKLAFEDVPIAEEQRRAQKQFAKATKEQQQAALRGGTGFEVEQKKKKEERGYGEWGGDVIGSWAEGGKRIAKNILSTIGYFAQTQAATDPMANLPYEKRQQMVQDASQKMYENATSVQNTFQDEIAKRNIQTSVLQAINKGEYSRLPESVLYTVGDAAMQILPSILTFGGSTYMQTLPQVYKDGVDAIAKEKGISPEQAVANGDDAFVVAQINSGLQSALEYLGAGLISKSIASRGAYKAMRDYLLKQGVNRNLARGASLLGVGTGEALTEYGQEGVGQIGKTAAKSPTVKAFFDKLPNELFTPEAKNQRAEAFVGGLVGGLGLAGGGQVVQSAMDRTLFEAPKIGKATQRPDMDVVQTDNKIQERNKIAQAMEEAVRANPEAEGQIRQQYQKRINEAAPADEEVLMAYESLALLPETDEKNTIRENLEAYMAEKGIAPQEEVETVSAEELQGPGFQIAYAKTREEIPQEYRGTIAEVERPTTRLGRFGPMEKVFAYRVPVETIDITAPEVTTEEDITEEIPYEEVPEETLTPEEEELSLEDQLMLPEEETVPVAPAEEEVVAEEIPAEEQKQEATNEQFDNLVNNRENINYESVVFDETAEGKKRRVSGASDIIDYAGRKIVIININGRNIPFYLSTGRGGKADVTSGKWYPIFGIGKDGWLNKLSGKEINDYYGSPILRGIAESLDRNIGDIRNDESIPKVGATGSHIAEINKDLNPTENEKANTRDVINQNIKDTIEFLDKQFAPQAAPVTQTEEVVSAAPVEEAAPEVPGGEVDRADLAGVVKTRLRKEGVSQEERNRLTGTRENPIITSATKSDYEALLKSYTANKEKQLADFEEGGREEGKFIPEKGIFLSSDTSFWDGKIKAVEQYLKNQAPVAPAPKGRKKKEAPVKPAPVTPKKEAAPKPEPKKEAPKPEAKKEEAPTEDKVVSGTPQEGDKVEIAPQREGFQPRAMVFKDGQWQQNVGGDIVKVGSAVQQQAQEAFAGKEGKKPAETKEGKKAEAKEERKETSFKGIASFETAKGSVYTVLPDGRTQRFKTATKEQNEPQDLTVFVKFKDAAQEQDFLEGVQRSETSGTKVYVIDKQGNKYDTNAQAAGKDVRLALVKDGKVIDTAETSTTPKIGYNTFDQRRFEKDGEKYREAHLGNKVVKINEQTKTEAQPEPAPSFTSQQSSEAATAFDKAKTSKGFDKKYGKGAYKALSDITKNFDEIMDKVSDKIKQDCL